MTDIVPFEGEFTDELKKEILRENVENLRKKAKGFKYGKRYFPPDYNSMMTLLRKVDPKGWTQDEIPKGINIINVLMEAESDADKWKRELRDMKRVAGKVIEND